MDAIAYTRTSTARQSTDRQINELKSLPDFTVKKVYTETISGYTKSVDERPELQKAIKHLREGDIKLLMVHEVSRLGRRTSEVLNLLETLKMDGIKVYVKSLGLTINGNGMNEAVNKLIITLMTDLARMESEQMSYRIKSGLAERKRKGLALGRQYGTKESVEKFMNKPHVKKIKKYLDRGETIRWIAGTISCSPTTVQKVKNFYN